MIMKRTFMISAIAVAAALFTVSCQKEQEHKPTKKLECTAQESYTVAATAAKSVSFDIAANTPWTIKSSENWCKVTPSSSKESSLAETIIVKFEDNTGSATREAILTIEGEGIEKPTLIKFIQAVPGKIVVTPFTEKFAKEGGKQTFTVVSNKPWAVTASPSDWLTFEPASGDASDQPVIVTATARYTDGKGHTATITVASEDAVQSFEASIEGLVFEVKELEEGEKVFDYKGGAKEIKVNANIDWNVSVSDEYFTASKTEGGIKVEAPMSKWFGKKTFTVTVTPVTTIEGVEPVTIDMAIAPASYIDNSDKSAYKINEDGSVTLTIAEKNEDPKKNQAFMKTFDEYKYGNFVWEFCDVKLTEGYFCVNNWLKGENPPYLMLKYGNNMALLAGGGIVSTSNGTRAELGFDNGWGSGWNYTWKFKAGTYPTDISQLKSIRMLIVPVKRTGTNQNNVLNKKVWVNDVLVLNNILGADSQDEGRVSGDIWTANPETKGFNYCTGIQDSVGSLTIKSFEIDTDYTKYEND